MAKYALSDLYLVIGDADQQQIDIAEVGFGPASRLMTAGGQEGGACFRFWRKPYQISCRSAHSDGPLG